MITVVVPIFNGAHVLPQSLPAMAAQSHKARWIFVDDGSTDGTRDTLGKLIAEFSLDATVLIHPENRGRSAARNTGVRYVETELVVFLDADAEPTPNCLAEFAKAMSNASVIAAVGRLLVEPDTPDEPYALYLMSSKRGPKDVQANAQTHWKYFITTNCCVRTDVLKEIGEFDEAISYGEDLDLASRLHHIEPNGLLYCPGATIRLHDVGTLENALDKMSEFGAENLPMMVERNPKLASWTGLDSIVSAPWPKRMAAKLLVGAPISPLIKSLLPYLPSRLSNLGVRYLLGRALARSYQSGSQL